MAQILIKGESVYKCTTCGRSARVVTSRTGIDVVQRCIITRNCKGKLQLVTSESEANSTPTFPPELPGVLDWIPRKMVYVHTQPIKARSWRVTHNLGSIPTVNVYVTRQAPVLDVLPSGQTTGTVWYKSKSGRDDTHPQYPTGGGLYVYDGTNWAQSPYILPVGYINESLYEYQILTQAVKITTTSANSVTVTFDGQENGIAQCVVTASQPGTTTLITPTVLPIQLTNNGELTIATLNNDPYMDISLMVGIAPNSIQLSYTNVDSTPSVLSPWSNTSRLYISTKTMTPRSFNINSGSGITVGSTKTPVNIIGRDTVHKNSVILLGSSPFLAIDRNYNRVVSVINTGDGMYIENGEMYIMPYLTTSVYPPIRTVD